MAPLRSMTAFVTSVVAVHYFAKIGDVHRFAFEQGYRSLDNRPRGIFRRGEALVDAKRPSRLVEEREVG